LCKKRTQCLNTLSNNKRLSQEGGYKQKMQLIQKCKAAFEYVKDVATAKKGNIGLGSLPTIAITLVVVAAVFVAGFLAIDGLSESSEPGTYAANSTAAIEEGMYNITNFLPTVGTLIGVGLLLGVILLAFMGFQAGRQRGMF